MRTMNPHPKTNFMHAVRLPCNNNISVWYRPYGTVHTRVERCVSVGINYVRLLLSGETASADSRAPILARYLRWVQAPYT